jgi:vacuolar-type H+-ATPase subunit H
MSDDRPAPRAADIAAQKVESIVAAAEASAEELVTKAREDGDRELEAARKKATELGRDARRSATQEVEQAQQEAKELREQTRGEMQRRVRAAEEAATQVLEEAKTLSSGLRQLGASLQSQGERILRDVQAAHKRMQADLRISLGDEAPAPRRVGPASRPREDSSSTATPEERERLERAAAELRESPARPGRRRDELDVPSWLDG